MTSDHQAPKLYVSGYVIEIEPMKGLWNKFRGRVVVYRRWATQSKADERPFHVYPTEPNPPNARTFIVGGVPYWLCSRSPDRLERRLRRWVEAKHAEADRISQRKSIPV